MTTEELAMHLIEHAAEKPGFITVEEAERIISNLDHSDPLPSDLSPAELQKQWNSIIMFDMPDIWI